MSGDACDVKTINGVNIWSNGIIRNKLGKIIGHLTDDIAYDNIVDEIPNYYFAIHGLKTAPEYFEATWNKLKNFEIRKNDREYKVGDSVKLREYYRNNDQYTGRIIVGTITYLTDYNQLTNHIVFGFKETHREEDYHE